MVALWHAQDVKNKENAYGVILEPIVQSLMLLESDNGVDVSVNGCIVKVRAALAIFSADNLGYHSLFGFLESFSANKFCRFCEATKEDAQTKFFENLSYLIADHHEMLLKIYPEKKLTPKHHFLVHYPTALVKCGPPCRYWCMRFEARHNFFKKVSRVTNCFKNIAKTLAKRNQLALAHDLLTNTVFMCRPVVGPSSEKLVGSMEAGKALGDYLKLSNSETVYVAKWVQIGHYVIKPKCVVLLQMMDGIPDFGLVEIIVSIKDKVFLVTKKLALNYFDDHFHAYCIDFLANTIWNVTYVSDVKDHIPLNIHCTTYEDKLLKLVYPRYVVM